MIQQDKLLEIVKEARQIIGNTFEEEKWDIDSANFQTKSKSDFENYAKEFEKQGLEFILTLTHAGRRINVYKVLDGIKSALNLEFIELSEPKPSRELADNQWEYVSVVVDNYDEFVKNAKSQKIELEKIRVIGHDKFCYWKTDGVSIQFRNKSVSRTENGVNGKEATAVTEEDQLQEEKEKRMRLMADFDNYRKLTEKRMQDLLTDGNQALFRELIEIADDFERAIENIQLEDGLKSIYTKLIALLEQNSIKPIDVKINDKFNPNIMEAVTTVEKAEHEDGTIVEVLQKGYINEMSGKTLRMARVIVAKSA